MNTKPTKMPVRLKTIVRIAVIALFLACMIFLFFACRKTGNPYPYLSDKFYGSVWECSNPRIVFSVDDTGFCSGHIYFEEQAFPIELALNHRHTSQIWVCEANADVYLFGGTSKIAKNKIILNGTWSAFLETRYGQPYEDNECTLIFIRCEP